MDWNLILTIIVGVWALVVLIVLLNQEKQILNLKEDYEAAARSHVDLAEAVGKHLHDQDERINDLDTATEKYFETLQKMNNDLAARVDKLQEDLELTDRVSEAVRKEVDIVKEFITNSKEYTEQLSNFVRDLLDTQKELAEEQLELENKINNMILPYQDDDKKLAECNRSYSIVKEDDDRQNDMKAISDLTFAMRMFGATSEEMERATEYAIVLADKNKTGDDVLQSEKDNRIHELVTKYLSDGVTLTEEVVADATTV